MKQFIVLAAVLPILMLFLAQFMLDGQRTVRMSAAEDAVRTFCLEGSYYGRIGSGEADALRAKVAGIFGISPGDVTVDLAPAREGVLSYRIAYPVGKIMAGAAFMGLSPSRNNGQAVMTGEIVLPPPKPEQEPEPEAMTETEPKQEPVPEPKSEPEPTANTDPHNEVSETTGSPPTE
jgi:hypothetical protein